MHLHFYKSFLFSNSIVDFPVYHIYVYALFYLPGSDYRLYYNIFLTYLKFFLFLFVKQNYSAILGTWLQKRNSYHFSKTLIFDLLADCLLGTIRGYLLF